MIAPILKPPTTPAAAPGASSAVGKEATPFKACASFSDTVRGETYSSIVSKSDTEYQATVSIPPAVTVRGGSAQEVEKALSQVVDFYA